MYGIKLTNVMLRPSTDGQMNKTKKLPSSNKLPGKGKTQNTLFIPESNIVIILEKSTNPLSMKKSINTNFTEILHTI